MDFGKIKGSLYVLNDFWLRPIILAIGAFLLVASKLHGSINNFAVASFAALSVWIAFNAYPLVTGSGSQGGIGFPLVSWLLQSKRYKCPFISKVYDKYLIVETDGFVFKGFVTGKVAKLSNRSIVTIPSAYAKLIGVDKPFRGIGTATHRAHDHLHTVSVTSDEDGRFMHMRWKKGSLEAYILHGKAQGLDGKPTSIITKTLNFPIILKST